LHPGETVALVGPSGAGKSTLLHIAGLLEVRRGEVVVEGRAAARCRTADRTSVRAGISASSINSTTCCPNSRRSRSHGAADDCRRPRGKARERARHLLSLVGLSQRETHAGAPLRRRAAARRDRPRPRQRATHPARRRAHGNLDQHTAEDVMNVLVGIVRDAGLAALIATHNSTSPRLDRIVGLEEGRLVER